MTVRKRIIELLGEGSRSVRELSQELHISERDVVDHLDHVGRALRGTLKTEPAVCLKCGFRFSKRMSGKKPGKCPVCKSEHISRPRFYRVVSDRDRSRP